MSLPFYPFGVQPLSFYPPSQGLLPATLTNHGILLGSGALAIRALGVGAAGTVLTGVTGADPAFSATPTLTSLTAPTLIGGAAVSSTLTLKSTTGNGSSDAIVFVVGNNGATEGGRFLTTGQLQLGAANQAANASVATVLGSVGPTGSHTTVQEWFAIANASGVTRYVPGF